MQQPTIILFTRRVLIPLCFLFLFQICLIGQDDSAPAIQLCGSDNTFCVEDPIFDICVNIIIPPGFNEPIDSFVINWGDGSTLTLPGNFDTDNVITYSFDFSSFINGTEFSTNEFEIQLETYIPGYIFPANNSTTPNFVNYPHAEIGNAQTIACVGEEVCFDNDSYPEENLTLIGWSFADGTPIPASGCFTFTTPGAYTLLLEVENMCGRDTAMHVIEVVEPATAEILVTEGVTNPGSGSDFTACMVNDTAWVTLDGETASQFVFGFYSWEVISGDNNGYIWIVDPPSTNPNQPVQQIAFLEAGTYQVRLITNNQCNQEAEDVLTITVEAGITLSPQVDACESLEYTPSPLLSDVNYTLNDSPVSEFPVSLGTGTYIVEAINPNSLCTALPIRDTFAVTSPNTAVISNPNDTLCSLDPPVVYSASPMNEGTWRINGSAFDGTIDPGELESNTTYLITYGNEPCLDPDTVYLTIVEGSLSLPADAELCIDGDPIQFTATPSGGIFSGVGVTSDGQFDPASVAPGEYYITYQVLNQALPSCSQQDSFLVTVTELLPEFSVSSCEEDTLCFELGATSDGVATSWDFDGTGTASENSPCHTFPDPGDYDVTLTVERNGCTASVTQTVSIEPPPIAGFSLEYNQSLCSELLVNITGQTVNDSWQYEWWVNGTLVSESAQPAPLTLEAGEEPVNHTILQIIRNGCTSVSAEETLTVQPQPTANFGTNLTQYCSGDTIRIANISSGLPTTYEWYFNGVLVGTDSIEPLVSYQTNISDTVALCLITTNACGTDTLCKDLVFIPTDVNALFQFDQSTICVNDSVQITNFSTPGAEVFYDLGDGNTTSQPDFSYSFAAPGQYSVRITAFGCGTKSFEQDITVIDAPTATWVNTAPNCPGDTISFFSTSPWALEHFWDFGDGTTSTFKTPQHQFHAPGNYEVCLTVLQTGPVDCDATLCQTITIEEPVTAGFEIPDSICAGAPVAISSTASQAPVSCFYDFGDGNTSNTCNPTHSYELPGSYLVTQILNNGCPDTAQQAIYVRQIPSPAFQTTVMDACTPDSVAFTNTSALATSYLWDFGDGTTSTLTNPTHVYETADSFTVTLTAFRDGICSAVSSQEVTIAESPVAQIGTDGSSICANQSHSFTSESTGNIQSYQWSMGDGTTAFTPTVNHQYEIAGTYQVQLLVSTEENCLDSTLIDVIVSPAISTSAVVTPVTCAGDTDGAVALDFTAGTAPFSTNWSTGAVSTSIEALTAGSYSVFVEDVNGCTWDSTFIVTEPATLQAATSTTLVTCAGGADGTIQVDTLTGGLPPYQINWEDGSSDAVRTNLSAGLYTLLLTDAQGCESMLEVQVTENPPITFQDSTLEISCYQSHDGAVTINNISGGTGPYEVFLSGPQIGSGVGITRFDSLGPGNYFLEVFDVNGCATSSEHQLINPSPASINIVDTIVELEIGANYTPSVFYNASEPTFNWVPSEGLSCSDCSNPVITPTQNTTYSIQLTDNRGCLAYDTLAVKVDTERSIWLPTAFTPNNDGRNDLFTVRSHTPLAIERISHFRILSRWGGKLFERQDFMPNNDNYGWDGKAGSKHVEPGVYTYEVEVRYVGKTDPEIVQGTVTLIR